MEHVFAYLFIFVYIIRAIFDYSGVLGCLLLLWSQRGLFVLKWHIYDPGAQKQS